MAFILPAFKRYPAEAAIIGRMLAGYGELEFGLAQCMAGALGDLSIATRILFRSRGEEHRISTADAILYPFYESYGLLSSWEIVRHAIYWCKGTRNQFSHCHWLDDGGNGLFFTHIEKGAKSVRGEVILRWFHVDASLLERHEAYFHHAQAGLIFLMDEQKHQDGKLQSHPWLAPRQIEPPPRHNPPGEHLIQSMSLKSPQPPK